MNRPDTQALLARLKPFQRRSVEHAFQRLFLAPDSSARFLVADEVGLGKTLVARGLVARTIEHLWDKVPSITVLYICSSQNIARANLPKLRIGTEHSAELATRLTMLATQLAPRDGQPSLRDSRINFVSFTPGPSFSMGHSPGARPEREVLFALIAPLVERRTALKNLLQGNVTRKDDWRRSLDEWPRPLEPEIARRFRAHLAAGSRLRAELDALLYGCFGYYRSTWPSDARTQRNELIGKLREQLAAVCVEALEPHLVILDEFQRFKSLLETREDRQDPAAKLFQVLVCNDTTRIRPVRTLLLSATPYKLYTTDAEIEQEDHYTDFLDTTRFLLDADEGRVAALCTNLSRFAGALKRASGGDTGSIIAEKAEVERTLLRIMCRSERIAASEDRDGMVEEHRPALSLSPAEVRQYLAADALFRAVGDGDPMPFWKSAPYLMHFMRGYKVNERLQEAIETAPQDVVSVLQEHADAFLNAGEIQSWQALEPAHAKLADLGGELLDTDLWRLLWMPPTQPYWPLQGAFAGQESATKTLIFSAWNLVPDLIAGWLSYEAERRMTAGRLTHYAEPDRQQVRLLRLTEGEGNVRTRHRLLLLLLPCLTLADRLHPLGAPAGRDRRDWVRDQAERLLADSRLPDPQSGPVDRRWEWAFPVLLDPGLNDLLCAWRDGDLSGLDGKSLEPPNPDVFRAYVDDLTGIDPQRLGRRPAGLAKLVAEVALGAPGVLAARMLGSAGISDDDRRKLAVLVADGFWRLFNRPAVISLLEQDKAVDRDASGKDDAYWRRVISYCIEGNLQAVLDEAWHLLWEQQAWSDNLDRTGVALECAQELADVVQPSVSRVHAQFFPIDQQNLIVPDEIRLRTDFALRFGDARGETAADDRPRTQDSVRKAFNSPFRPFVLASTSIGQEGLDFHPWCHRVVHWNLPGNPVDLEQREGRVNRYKGHAVRRNVAARHAEEALRGWGLGDDLWQRVFELAERTARARGDSDLVPCWIAQGPYRVQRRVPLLPYTREVEAFRRLKRQLAAYRVVFGQPRQEELLTLLDASSIDIGDLRAWAIDLSPPDPQAASPRAGQPMPEPVAAIDAGLYQCNGLDGRCTGDC